MKPEPPPSAPVQTPPCLLLLIGLPGSGKSTLARALSARLALPVIDREAILAAMFPDDAAVVGDEAVEAATGGLWLALRARLGAGQGCIVDGMSFSGAAERAYAQGLAQAFGAVCLQLAIEVSQRLAIQRLAGREGSAARVRRAAAAMAPLGGEVIRLDGRQSPDRLADAVEAVLAAGPVP